MKIFRNFKLFLTKLTLVIALTTAVFGFLLIFYPLSPETTNKLKISMILVFLLANIIIAYILSLPKKKISINVTQKVKVNVFFGDLFKARTNIIIPVNEYFDTIVDDVIVSRKTLHGLFVNNEFGSNVETLDTILNEKLKDIPFTENFSRIRGKTKKYHLGTTVTVEKDRKKFFVFALTNFDQNHKASSSNIDYQLSIHSLLKHIHTHNQGYEVSIPLIGAGPSGIKLSKQELLEYLISSIRLHEDLTVSGGINLILHKDLMGEIDLNKIEYISSFDIN